MAEAYVLYGANRRQSVPAVAKECGQPFESFFTSTRRTLRDLILCRRHERS